MCNGGEETKKNGRWGGGGVRLLGNVCIIKILFLLAFFFLSTPFPNICWAKQHDRMRI